MLSPFKFHGVNIATVKGGQVISDCPLCGKPGHFFINVEEGTWDCKVCLETGNVYTFLRKLIEQLQGETTDKHLATLAKLRGLPPKEAVPLFRECGIAYRHGTRQGEWLIPTTNANKTVTNIHVYHYDEKAKKGKGGYILHATEGMPLSMYYPAYRPEYFPPDDPRQKDNPFWLCEGHFDPIALELYRRKHNVPALIGSVPGAGSFKERWLAAFNNRRVINFVYDNDEAGKKQDSKALVVKDHYSGSIVNTIQWPKSARVGYDINDYVTDNWKNKNGWKTLERHLESIANKGYIRKREGPPPTFASLVKKFREHFYLDEHMAETWAISLAAVVSDKTRGEPLWLFVVGPPSSGKTVMLRSMEHSTRCIYRSVITPASLISGYISKDSPDDDPSLIRILKHKTLVIKDYTTILGLPSGIKQQLEDILRDAYDGQVSKSFGHLPTGRSYTDHLFGMVAGVTHAIEHHSKGSLGERFLRVEFLPPDHDDTKQLRKAIKTTTDPELAQNEIRVLSELKDLVADFLDNTMPDKLPKVPIWVENRITPLVQVIAHLRTEVVRDYKGNPVSRPRVEIGSRIAKQLLHLAQALTVVHGKRTVDKSIYATIQRVGFDSVSGWKKDIFLCLAENPKAVLTREEIAERTNIHGGVVYNNLQDMEIIGIVEHTKLDSTEVRRGPKTHGYSLTPKLLNLWKQAKV